MARIDSLLGLAKQQGADELHVGVGKEPRMFARGTPKRLSIPATSEETLRALLDEILSPEREHELRQQGTLEVGYEGRGLGVFRVTLSVVGGGFAAVFRSGEAAAAAPAAAAPRQAEKPAAPAPAPPPATPARKSAAPPPPPAASPSAPPPSSATVAGPAFAALVQQAAALHASDLHLAEGEYPTVRVAGTLRQLAIDVPNDLAALLTLDAVSGARIARGEAVDLAIEVPGSGRVRVHFYPSAQGPIAAVRLLPLQAPSFSALNMPLAFDDLVQLPHGLVLVCGPAGSGKSTTLAALAQEALRARSIVLVTLEDPIEYTLSAFNQSLIRRRQIGRDVRDFATGLRDALRADPELLLLGELRDPESIALALTAAETGHLVLASMHSGSAASAVERIVDAAPIERQPQVRLQLADSLRAVIAQRLLRRSHAEGRIPAVEVLRVTRAAASLIREGKTNQFGTVLQSSKREGMISLERSLADRVHAGEIRSEDAYAAANDTETLKVFLSRTL